MAARRCDPHRRALYGGIELRRILRPVRHRRRGRPDQLARLVRRHRAAHAGRRHRRRRGLAARAPVRALRGAPRLRPANARASARSAPPRHLRGRLRGPVQLHRRLHLRELSSGGTALPVSADAPRRHLRHLPRRQLVGALDRPRGRAVRPPTLRARRHRGLDRRRSSAPGVACRHDHRRPRRDAPPAAFSARRSRPAM